MALNIDNLLQLCDRARISVEALGDIGDGGNLSIDTNTIALLNNSLIRANAVGGRGAIF